MDKCCDHAYPDWPGRALLTPVVLPLLIGSPCTLIKQLVQVMLSLIALDVTEGLADSRTLRL